MLNPDVRLSPHSVPPLLAALREPGTGIVVPQLRSPDGTLEPSLRRTPTLLRAVGLEKTGLAALSERIASPAEYTLPARGGLGAGRRGADLPGVLRQAQRLG